jgi:hypothetical protein
MSFYLSVSLAVFALVAYDLIAGKTTWGARGHIMGMRPGAYIFGLALLGESRSLLV